MDNNYVLQVIDNYFNQLFTTGSTSIQTQNKVLILSYIRKMLCGIFMNEEDYKQILKYLENIYGDCIIPYPSFNEFVNSHPIESRLKVRSTQDGVARVDSSKHIRVALD